MDDSDRCCFLERLVVWIRSHHLVEKEVVKPFDQWQSEGHYLLLPSKSKYYIESISGSGKLKSERQQRN